MGSALTQFVLLWWILDEARFVEDLGAASLDSVELFMAFKEDFDIEITDEAAEAVATVGEVFVGIENAVGES